MRLLPQNKTLQVLPTATLIAATGATFRHLRSESNGTARTVINLAFAFYHKETL